MNVNLEQIDELRKRANVSYEEAKEALEKHDGNLVDALIELERGKRMRASGMCDGSGEFVIKAKKTWKKGNKIRLIVKRNGMTLLNLPLAISILIGLVGMHFTIAAVVLALIFGCRFSLENGDEVVKANETLVKVQDNIEDIKKKITEEF